MPLYVYSCPECEIVLEELRPLGMADWPPVECPVCHGFCDTEITSASLGNRHTPLESIGEWQPLNEDSNQKSAAMVHGQGCPCCRTGLR